MTASLLPNAKQQFISAEGIPFAGGLVYFYVPNTSTPKNTWQDADQQILNTNPIILDAAGEAIIYGSGIYRQVVYDANGNLIWDELTQDLISTIQSSTALYCGVSTGTPNAQVVSPTPAVTSIEAGQQFSFIAGFSNTNAMTLTINALTYPVYHGGAPVPANSVIAGAATIVQMNDSETQFELVNPWQLPNPGTSGNLMESNGTNWISAAPKLPAPGANGNVLQSNGSAWISTGLTIPNPILRRQIFLGSSTFVAPVETVATPVQSH